MIKDNHIIPWWIWGIMSIICASTLTDWGAIAAIVSAIILIGTLCYRWRIIQSPFRMQVITNIIDFQNGERHNLTFSNNMNITIGDDVKLIRVIPKRATSFSKINVRFVNRKLSMRFNRIWRYDNADANIIKVTELEDVDFREKGEEWGRSYFESEEDGFGGFSGIYSPALSIRQDDIVWYYVWVKGVDEWNGFISFEGTLDNRRVYSRIKARVNMPRVISMP